MGVKKIFLILQLVANRSTNTYLVHPGFNVGCERVFLFIRH